MAYEKRPEFMIENARLVFLNFGGKEDMYNAEGNRNFSVILEPDVAEQMLSDGWNVKQLKLREDDERDQGDYYLQVTVGYKLKPPHVVMIGSKSGNRTNLTQETIEVLDWADIATVDFIANASFWEVNGKSGIKAYLKSMFVTFNEDPLELKYAIKTEPETTES